MEILWVFGTFGALIGALLTYVGIRDRRRLSSADDSAAARAAIADAHRHIAAADAQMAARTIHQQVKGQG